MRSRGAPARQTQASTIPSPGALLPLVLKKQGSSDIQLGHMTKHKAQSEKREYTRKNADKGVSRSPGRHTASRRLPGSPPHRPRSAYHSRGSAAPRPGLPSSFLGLGTTRAPARAAGAVGPHCRHIRNAPGSAHLPAACPAGLDRRAPLSPPAEPRSPGSRTRFMSTARLLPSWPVHAGGPGRTGQETLSPAARRRQVGRASWRGTREPRGEAAAAAAGAACSPMGTDVEKTCSARTPQET